MTRDVRRQRPPLRPFSADGIDLAEAVRRVLLHPTVADKTFLVTIGDRTVGRPLLARPDGRPVAGAGRRLRDDAPRLRRLRGRGLRRGRARADRGRRRPRLRAHGGRPRRSPTWRRRRSSSLSRVKLSANWMAAAGSPGEDAALFDTVKAVALDLCPRLGVGIPVGKDSMSMRTTWEEHGVAKAVVAPLSLVVSAFAPCDDVRGTWTPQLRTDRGATDLVFVDLAGGRRRLGGSILAQVFGQTGNEAPDLDEPERIKGLYAALAELRAAGARPRLPRPVGRRPARRPWPRWPSPGTPASTLDLGVPRRPRGRHRPRPGRPLQRGAGRRPAVRRRRPGAGPGRPRPPRRSRASCSALRTRRTSCGSPAAAARSSRSRAPRSSACGPRRTFRMQALRDNPESARQEHDRILDADDPGLSPALTFDPAEDVAAPFVARGARPRMAILREQGVNGQVEMAAAFDRAGLRGDRRPHERRDLGPRLALRLQGLRRLRRLLLRRRARRRRGLGQVDPLQPARPRRVRGLLRAARTPSPSASATAAR